jgi:hypothetical protein
MVTQSDNVIVVCYPPFAGGKFLINSLGISASAYFQDIDLVSLQEKGKFNTKDKFAFLISAIKNISSEWRDLELGCDKLLGLSSKDFNNYSRSEILNLLPKILLSSHKFYFLVVHSSMELEAVLNVYDNPKIILFTETDQFIKDRLNITSKLYSYWKKVATVGWPDTPPQSVDEYIKLPKQIYNNLEITHSNEIYKMIMNHDEGTTQEFQEILKGMDIEIWNTNWYFSKRETLRQLNKLYDRFELSPVDTKYLSQYYDKWIQKLEMLKC